MAVPYKPSGREFLDKKGCQVCNGWQYLAIGISFMCPSCGKLFKDKEAVARTLSKPLSWLIYDQSPTIRTQSPISDFRFSVDNAMVECEPISLAAVNLIGKTIWVLSGVNRHIGVCRRHVNVAAGLSRMCSRIDFSILKSGVRGVSGMDANESIIDWTYLSQWQSEREDIVSRQDLEKAGCDIERLKSIGAVAIRIRDEDCIAGPPGRFVAGVVVGEKITSSFGVIYAPMKAGIPDWPEEVKPNVVCESKIQNS